MATRERWLVLAEQDYRRAHRLNPRNAALERLAARPSCRPSLARKGLSTGYLRSREGQTPVERSDANGFPCVRRHCHPCSRPRTRRAHRSRLARRQGVRAAAQPGTADRYGVRPKRAPEAPFGAGIKPPGAGGGAGPGHKQAERPSRARSGAGRRAPRSSGTTQPALPTSVRRAVESRDTPGGGVRLPR